MSALLFLGFTALILSLILTPLLSRVLFRLGVVDYPDQQRKLHARPVARAGGVPIAMSYGGAVFLAWLLFRNSFHLASHHTAIFEWLAPAALLILLTGLVDDAIGLKPIPKLLNQFLAAGIACWGGVRIMTIAGHHISPWIGVPITLFWIVSCTNALNLIDGLDGLATGVGLFATLTAFTAACLQDNIGLALATVPLIGALLGFLRYNFNPASVFLGDSGSLMIGFLLSCFAVIWSQKAATLLGMAAPLISLLVPLTDVSVAVIRRFLCNRPIFAADGRHIHHRLLARGLNQKTAALVLYSACGAAAVLSIADSLLSRQIGGYVVLLVCLLACIGVRALGYDEFSIARQLAISNGFRRAVDEQLCLRKFQVRIAEVRTFEECWPIIRDLCRDLRFHSVTLLSPAQSFTEQMVGSTKDSLKEPRLWQLRIAIDGNTELILRRIQDRGDVLPGMECLRTIQLAIQEKLPAGPLHVPVPAAVMAERPKIAAAFAGR